MPHPYGFEADQLSLPIDVVARHGADVDKSGRFPEESIAALGAAGLLGLTVPAELGGLGQGPRAFCVAAEELAPRVRVDGDGLRHAHVRGCRPSPPRRRSPIATRSCARSPTGKHLTTLALSEKGSRSQFWAPVSKLAAKGDGFVTSAAKSWVTSANLADSYVSSAQAPGAQSPLESTIYLARTGAAEVRPQGAFDGLGLRGNDSSPGRAWRTCRVAAAT